MTEEDNTNVIPSFIEPDFCDECGPGVMVHFWVTMPSGLELTYCGHHGTKYKAALLEAGATVNDLTYIAMQR